MRFFEGHEVGGSRWVIWDPLCNFLHIPEFRPLNSLANSSYMQISGSWIQGDRYARDCRFLGPNLRRSSNLKGGQEYRCPGPPLAPSTATRRRGESVELKGRHPDGDPDELNRLGPSLNNHVHATPVHILCKPLHISSCRWRAPALFRKRFRSMARLAQRLLCSVRHRKCTTR
jgi:hypothetical protein